jgi:carbon monoxide dehydrogenase subunit G
VRKLARVAAPPLVVAEMFRNLERWSAWMPGVESVRLLEESSGGAIALIRQRWKGRILEQKWSFRFDQSSLTQEQIKGFFRRWRAAWSFVPAPDGEGTTVTVDLDIDLGMLGWVTPGRIIQETLDGMFAEVIDKARARARAILAGETTSIPAGLQAEDALLAVFETTRGIELHLWGRRFLIHEIDE